MIKYVEIYVWHVTKHENTEHIDQICIYIQISWVVKVTKKVSGHMSGYGNIYVQGQLHMKGCGNL